MNNIILKHLLHSADQILTLCSIYYAFWMWYLALVALEGFQEMLARSDFLPACFFFSLLLSLSFSLVLSPSLQAQGSRQLPPNPESGIRGTAWQLVCYCHTGTGSEQQDWQRAQKRKRGRFKMCFYHGNIWRNIFRISHFHLKVPDHIRKWLAKINLHVLANSVVLEACWHAKVSLFGE